MEYKFDCIIYYVSDLDASVAFYRDVLGFRLLSRETIAKLEVDGVALELIPTKNHDRLSGKGNARLSLGVDDIEQVMADLRMKGVDVGKPIRVPNGRLGSIRDRDGNEISLWQEV